MTELKWLGFIIMMVIILRFLFFKIFPPQKYATKNREADKYNQEYPDDETPPKNPFDSSIETGDLIGPFDGKSIHNPDPNPKKGEMAK